MSAWLKRGLRVALTLAVVVGGVVAGVYVWRSHVDDPWTRDGRVRADIVRLGPDVSGPVTEVRVIDNQIVRKGDVMFVVDQERFRLALELSRATEEGRSSDLDLVGFEDITPHYAKTLRLWRAAFLDRLDQVRALGYDEDFIRLWDFYLAYCEGGFAERAINSVQLVMARPRWRTDLQRRLDGGEG